MKVLGTPKPSLQWFKDDMEVFSSERLDIREEEDGGIVVVKEVIINRPIIIQENKCRRIVSNTAKFKLALFKYSN